MKSNYPCPLAGRKRSQPFGAGFSVFGPRPAEREFGGVTGAGWARGPDAGRPDTAGEEDGGDGGLGRFLELHGDAETGGCRHLHEQIETEVIDIPVD